MSLTNLLRRMWVCSTAYRRGTRWTRRQIQRTWPLALEPLEGRLCPSLTLTQAGRNAGIVLSVFAGDFPNGQYAGPLGVAFPSSGGVLVTDFPGNVRRFATDTDGQSANWFPPGQNYGASGAFGLAQVGGSIYMLNQHLRDLDRINDNGTLNEVIIHNLATSGAGPTGIVANPANGHLFVSVQDGHQSRIVDVDPVARTFTTFANTDPEMFPDGLAISVDAKVLYVSGNATGHIKGYDIATGQIAFDSGVIAGGVDGVAEGVGPLAGKLFVNTNSGTVVELDIATHQQTVIASGGSRGDFVTIDPHDGSALFTQTDRIVRFTFPFDAARRLTAAGFPSPSTAGTPGSITVTALDQNGQFATGYAGTVHFTSSDGQATLPADYTFTAADRGQHTFSGITLTTAGSRAITVTDISDPRLAGTQAGIVATPADTTTLSVAVAGTTQAGEPRALTVTAQDQYGNTTPVYTGTVHLTTGDGQAILEGDHTFTAADQGAYAFGVVLFTAGAQMITATDVDGAISGTAKVVVIPAPAVAFILTAPASVPSGTPFDVTVTALDPYGNTDVNYQGTVTFSTTDPDPAVVLPADYTFTTADAGIHTFLITLHTLGNQIITVQDTATDAIMGSATVAVISPALFYPAVNYPVGRQPTNVAVGDFNGDGIPDLVTANGPDGTISVLLGNGDGSFGSARSYPAGAGPTWVAVSDFNGDGLLDLVVGHGYSSPAISVLFGNGDGSFQAPVDYPAGGYPSEIAVGDLNSDGILDLVVGHTADSTVGVLLGKPDGTFLPVVNYTTGTFSRAAVIGDFNGDGIPDIAAVDQGADSVSILQGNGDGTFRPAINYAVGSAPTSLAVGDFNGDGALDLVTANFTFGGNVGTVSVLLNQGDGTFRPARNYNVGRNPHSVTVGDFDGDGIPDLAVANNGSGTVSILLGAGDGSFQAPITVGVGLNPFSVVADDLNNDGFPDLAVANGGSNSVSVLLNTRGQSGSPGVGSRRTSARVMPDPDRASWVGVSPALPTAPKPAGVPSIGGVTAARISREEEQRDWAFATLGSSSRAIAWQSDAARLFLRDHAKSGQPTGLSFDLDDLAGAVEPLPWELD